MQFQVPQFLDVEDKIIGPFTIKQFIYLMGGLGMGYIAFRFIPFIGSIIGLGLLALGWALGFYKYNGKPFVDLVESLYAYYTSGRLYVWKRREKPVGAALDLSNFQPTKHVSALSGKQSGNKLNTLAWSVEMKQENEEDELS